MLTYQPIAVLEETVGCLCRIRGTDLVLLSVRGDQLASGHVTRPNTLCACTRGKSSDDLFRVEKLAHL